MAKAISDLKSKKNNFDMLIEIVDARAINISSNKQLLKDFNLPVLTIAVKSDIAEINSSNDLLYISTKNKSHRQIVLNKIKEVLKPKIESKKKKGLINPQFNILVLGLPNIGKSSFINFVLNKNNLVVQNYPGVTRKQTLVKIDNMLFLNDSP
ncbi:MAG: 50S ribosome-binding GTPase, partial [Mycoplasmoidaceae bacterium]|nr:50S ribosome-binding GTPase [Mycoplasmoidaceae bacterium]